MPSLAVLDGRISKLELLFKQLSDWLNFQPSEPRTFIQNQVDIDGNSSRPKKSKGRPKKKELPQEDQDEFITVKIEIEDNDDEEQQLDLMELNDSMIFVKQDDHNEEDGSGEMDNIQEFNLANFNDHPSSISTDDEEMQEQGNSHDNDGEVKGSSEYEPLILPGAGDKSVAKSRKVDKRIRVLKPSKCPHCNKSFRFVRDFEEHVRLHTGDKPFRCDKCDYSTGRKRNLQHHIARRHAKRTSTFQPDLVTQSVNKETTDKMEVKEKPEDLNDSTIYLQNHEYHNEDDDSGVTGNQEFNLLNFNYENDNFDNVEMQDVSEQEQRLQEIVPVEEENVVAKGSQSTQNQQAATIWKCVQCEKTFRDRRELQEHFRVHTKEKPYNCYLCEHSTARKRNLKAHFEKRHKTTTFEPELVTQSTSTASDYQMETPNIPDCSFECEYCKKKFLVQAGLSSHRNNVHRHEPNFKKLHFECPHCQKRFTSKKSLYDHTLSHTKEKTYLCNICGKAMGTSVGLREHIRLHEDPSREERKLNLSCYLCPMKFNTSRDLDCHIRRHTGEKPFKCPKCDYASLSLRGLQRHQKRNHEGTAGS